MITSQYLPSSLFFKAYNQLNYKSPHRTKVGDKQPKICRQWATIEQPEQPENYSILADMLTSGKKKNQLRLPKYSFNQFSYLMSLQ